MFSKVKLSTTYKLLSLLILLSISTGVFSQSKGDNTIVVSGQSTSIKSLGKFLINWGYKIKSIDDELGFLYTDYIEVPNSLYSYRADFKVDGNKILGIVYIKKVLGQDAPASWRGGDRKPSKVTFYHLYKTLSKYSTTKTVRL